MCEVCKAHVWLIYLSAGDLAEWPADMAFSRRQMYIHAEDHMPVLKGCSCSLGFELIIRHEHDRLLSVRRQLIHDTRATTRHCCNLRSCFLMR